MILVDFDNTLICNRFDLDHDYNKQRSVAWFRSKVKSEDVNFSWANLLLADWLKDKDFFVCTNRGIETHEQTNEALFHLFNDVPSVFYCTGTKREVLRNIEIDYFLIDNNQDYNPNFLFTECISIAELDRAYNQWLKERGKYAVNNG